jgi:hypothetical protein
MSEIKDKPKEVDWRLQATSTLSKPWLSPWTGNNFKIGSRVTSTSIVKYREKKTLSIPIPNAVAMCLKVSSSAHKSAYELIKV